MQYAFCTDFGMSQADITKMIGLYKTQTKWTGLVTPQKIISRDLLFHLFPTFSPLPHGPKITRLKYI